MILQLEPEWRMLHVAEKAKAAEMAPLGCFGPDMSRQQLGSDVLSHGPETHGLGPRKDWQRFS